MQIVMNFHDVILLQRQVVCPFTAARAILRGLVPVAPAGAGYVASGSIMSGFQSKATALAPALLMIVDEVLAFRQHNPAAQAVLPSQEKLRQDMQQFCLLLQQLESVRDKDPEVISDMGEYGLYLLQKLSEIVEQLGLLQARQRLDRHVISFGLWICTNGGALRELEPIVNAFAAEANRSRGRDLEHLCAAMLHCVHCVDPLVVERQERVAAAPWRLLNLNVGIVATRTHNTELIRAAFEALIRNLPEEAPDFFGEGMEQLDLAGYPEPVRDLVERYYHRFAKARTLH